MIKRYTTTLLLSLALSSFVSAQTAINFSSHAMRVGDQLTLKTLDTISAGNAGPNQVWDFSNASIGSDFTINYNADNTASSTTGTSFNCDLNGDRDSYYEITTANKLYYGLKAGTAEIKFDTPLKEMSYPFVYGSEITGSMTGTYTANGVSSPITGSYSVKADAYGTITLPNGETIENVLRVKILRDYNHEHLGSPYHMTVVKYAFYSNNSRYPVLQISDADMDCQCACGGRDYKAYFDPSARSASITDIDESTQSHIRYKVYPNPVKEDFSIDYKLPKAAKVRISLVDLNGKEIKVIQNKKQAKGEYHLESKIEGGHAQAFLLQFKVGDKLYTEKLMKQQK